MKVKELLLYNLLEDAESEAAAANAAADAQTGIHYPLESPVQMDTSPSGPIAPGAATPIPPSPVNHPNVPQSDTPKPPAEMPADNEMRRLPTMSPIISDEPGWRPPVPQMDWNPLQRIPSGNYRMNQEKVSPYSVPNRNQPRET